MVLHIGAPQSSLKLQNRGKNSLMVGHFHVKVMSLILEARASVPVTSKLILSFQYVLTLGNLVEEMKDGRIISNY